MASQITDTSKQKERGLLNQAIHDFSGLSEKFLAVLYLAERAQKLREKQAESSTSSRE